MESHRKVAIIGAGAAGCFCAVQLKRRHPYYYVTIYESGSKPLAKVSITGGGRCNFTNSFEHIEKLEDAYPRGANLMKRALHVLSNEDVMQWFENEGIPYTIQEDGCVFPQSQDAMQIVNRLVSLMAENGVELRCNTKVENIIRENPGFKINCVGSTPENYDYVVVTTGGGALKPIENLGIEIEKPLPSLFTLKIEDSTLHSLMGIVSEHSILSISGTKYQSSGPLLITDWGLSGPSVLKLTSYAAKHLAQNGYKCKLKVNWNGASEADIREFIQMRIKADSRRFVANVPPPGINVRLWKYLLSKCGIRDDIVWAELGSKGTNRLVNVVCSDELAVSGRCHFKAEFVTCGGVSLKEINLNTMESKLYPGLFFAGEVMDVDGITGGFNLQAAWSTGYVAAENI